jgi:hypothetical protein
MSRLSHFLHSRVTDGGEVVNLTRQQPFTPPGRFVILIFVRGWVDPRAIMRLQGLGQLQNPMTSGIEHSPSNNYATACPWMNEEWINFAADTKFVLQSSGRNFSLLMKFTQKDILIFFFSCLLLPPSLPSFLHMPSWTFRITGYWLAKQTSISNRKRDSSLPHFFTDRL